MSAKEKQQARISQFECLVHDKNMRDCILGDMDDPFDYVENFYAMYKNVIDLAFVYVFSCCKDLANKQYDPQTGTTARERCLKAANANSSRVLRTLDKVYLTTPASNELIQFVLMDVYFDFISITQSPLRRYIPDCFCGEIDLSEYFSLINKSLFSSRLSDLDFDSAWDKLLKLLRAFGFLLNTSLCYDEERDWYVFKRIPDDVFDDGIINTFGIIRKITDRNEAYYYLYSVENETDMAMRYERLDHGSYIMCAVKNFVPDFKFGEVFGEPYEIHYDREYIETFLGLCDVGHFVSGKHAALNQIYNINYKYIKNLALAISDAIGKGVFAKCKDALRDAFKGEYPEIFDKENNGSGDWDTIVVMLLIEVGPSRVMQVVFLADRNIGDYVLQFLRLRFGGEIKARLDRIGTQEEFVERAENIVAQGLRFDGETSRKLIKLKTRENDKLIAEAMAGIILDALTADTMQQRLSYDFNINIKQNIEAIENIRKKSLTGQFDDARDEQYKFVKSVIVETLKRIICFYRGIFGCGEIKAEYDRDSSENILSDEKICEYQSRINEAFLGSAKAAVRELKAVENSEHPVEGLIEALLKLCRECVCTNGSVFEKSKNSKSLHAVIGRDNIMNVREFEEHLSHVISERTRFSPENIDWWTEKTIDILKFLQYGSFDTAKGNLMSAVYPIVAEYNKSNDNCDGYHTSMFMLEIEVDADGDGMVDFIREVNVLSEFAYTISHRYYCLPNAIRSTDKWWLDPFIIRCKDFDEIFTEKE